MEDIAINNPKMIIPTLLARSALSSAVHGHNRNKTVFLKPYEPKLHQDWVQTYTKPTEETVMADSIDSHILDQKTEGEETSTTFITWKIQSALLNRLAIACCSQEDFLYASLFMLAF